MKAKEQADKEANMLQEWRDRHSGNKAGTYFTGVLVRQYYNSGDVRECVKEFFINSEHTVIIEEALIQERYYPDQLRVIPVYALIDL